MEEYTEATKQMIPFFRQMADDIENNNLTTSQLLIAGQLFMKYKYDNEINNGLVIDEQDIDKYLFTGWYMHTIHALDTHISNENVKKPEE